MFFLYCLCITHRGETLHRSVVYQCVGKPLPSSPAANAKIRCKAQKFCVKHTLHSLYGHFRWSQYQKNEFRKLPFMSSPPNIVKACLKQHLCPFHLIWVLGAGEGRTAPHEFVHHLRT